MDLLWSDEGGEERFAAYLTGLSQALGHADRVGPFRSSCTGLLLPGERKSVEPMAARRRCSGASRRSRCRMAGREAHPTKFWLSTLARHTNRSAGLSC